MASIFSSLLKYEKHISGWVFTVVLILLICIPLYEHIPKIINGSTTEGVIVGKHVEKFGLVGHRRAKYCTIKYVVGDIEYSYSVRNEDGCKPGEKIEIIYSNFDPSNSCELSFTGLFVNNGLIFGIGLSFLWIFFFIAIKSSPKGPKEVEKEIVHWANTSKKSNLKIIIENDCTIIKYSNHGKIKKLFMIYGSLITIVLMFILGSDAPMLFIFIPVILVFLPMGLVDNTVITIDNHSLQIKERFKFFSNTYKLKLKNITGLIYRGYGFKPNKIGNAEIKELKAYTFFEDDYYISIQTPRRTLKICVHCSPYNSEHIFKIITNKLKTINP